MSVEFLFKELVQGNRNFITKNFLFYLQITWFSFKVKENLLLMAHITETVPLVSRTTRSMTCDTVRIFSLSISLSLLNFSHMLTSCFSNKDNFFSHGKEHGHLQPWSHFPEVLPVERKDMISAPSSQKYPGADVCMGYVSVQANFSGQTVRQCYWLDLDHVLTPLVKSIDSIARRGGEASRQRSKMIAVGILT